MFETLDYTEIGDFCLETRYYQMFKGVFVKEKGEEVFVVQHEGTVAGEEEQQVFELLLVLLGQFDGQSALLHSLLYFLFGQ